MKQPGLGLSAFSLPKLKRDVAAKMLPNMRDGGNSQPRSSTDAAAPDAHSKQGMQQQISKDAEAGANNENADPSSPNKAATKAAASKQPATARKGRRTKQQTRVSEQHTVYYDAMGSPEDAHTRAQHNSHAAGRFAAAAAAAAVAPAPTSVHSKPARRATQQAAGAELDTATAADTDVGGPGNSGTDADLFGSQPEPMEEDDNPYASSTEFHATAGDPHSLKARTPAPAAAAGRKQARAAQQQQHNKEQLAVPRPSSRQQRHAAEQSAAAAAASRQAAEAAAESDPDTDQEASHRQQERQQERQQQGRGLRGRGPAGAQEAAGDFQYINKPAVAQHCILVMNACASGGGV